MTPEPRPIAFPGHNYVYKAPEGLGDKIGDLPVHRTGAQHTTCWQLHWKDRIRILFTGRIWVLQLSHQMPPMSVQVANPLKPAP